MTEKWCEHRKFISESFDISLRQAFSDFQCPWCKDSEAKRPPEKKKLWEILEKAWRENPSENCFKTEAKAAIEEVERVIDEYYKDGYCPDTANVLKQKVRELL